MKEGEHEHDNAHKCERERELAHESECECELEHQGECECEWPFLASVLQLSWY